MNTTAARLLMGRTTTAPRTHRPAAPPEPVLQESLKALVRELMGPAARQLGRAPVVHEVEVAAVALTSAVRADMRARAAQLQAARTLLVVAGEVGLAAVVLIRAAGRLRRSS